MTTHSDPFDANSPCNRKIREMLNSWLQAHLSFHALQYPGPTREEYEKSMGQAYEKAEFMRQYVAHMMLEGDSDRSRLARIRRFLNLQSGEPEPPYAVRFQGPVFHGGITVGMEEKRELDFADAHAITDFTRFAIARTDGRQWARRAANALLQEIIEDLEFDGLKPRLQMRVMRNVLLVKATIR